VSELFVPTADGIRITLPEGLVEFLKDVPTALDHVGTTPNDPAADRFRVPVYLDDDDSNDEFWRWMGSELDESRAADRSAFALIVESAEQGVVASPGEASGFLRVLVEIRLALAARLGVQVEADYEKLDHTDAVVLDTLAELQILLLQAMSS
jgi:hypothetical protein